MGLTRLSPVRTVVRPVTAVITNLNNMLDDYTLMGVIPCGISVLVSLILISLAVQIQIQNSGTLSHMLPR
jgi:hypothetical protein